MKVVIVVPYLRGGVIGYIAANFFLSDLFGMSDSAIESTNVGRSLEPGPSF